MCVPIAGTHGNNDIYCRTNTTTDKMMIISHIFIGKLVFVGVTFAGVNMPCRFIAGRVKV